MIRLLLLLLIFILYSCSGGTTTEYRSAKTYVSANNYNEAEKIALEGIKNNPEDALTPYYLALNIYGASDSPKQNYIQTAKYFSLAIEIDNKNEEDQLLPDPIPVINKSEQTVELITVKDAIFHYRYIIWVEIFNKSIELIKLGDTDQAIEQLNIAALIDPNNPKTYDMLARVFLDSQNLNKALENANKALSFDKSLTDLLTLKAQISQSRGDNLQAEVYLQEAYDTAIKNNESPDRLTNHMKGLFDVLFANGKKDKALKLSEQLIEKDPENVLLYSNAGALYQNILLEQQNQANDSFSKLNTLNEQQLEDLKLIYQDCINLARKSRENFLMCNQFELDETKAENYYQEAKRIKIIINDLKSQIRRIDKRIDEL